MDRLGDEGDFVTDATLDTASLKKTLAINETFDRDLTNWVMEGGASASIRDSRLHIASRFPGDPKGKSVFWHKQDVVGDQLIEFDYTPIKDGLCILFFCAKGRKGEDLFEPSLPKREGVFKRYHSGAINTYHISYHRQNPWDSSYEAILRKHYGCNMLQVGRDPIRALNRAYHLAVLRQGGRIRYAVDGRVTLDCTEDGKTFGPVLTGGKIGLRQMSSMVAAYDNFRVWTVSP